MKPPHTDELAPLRACDRWADTVKLTSLASCAGCTAKLGQSALTEIMELLPPVARDARLLAGSGAADDAAVFGLTRNLALVQAVDFFPPVVDDAFAFGQIAAANAISHVYAMGGRPLSALNLLGLPQDRIPPEVIACILRGGLRKAQECRCAVVGGHPIRLPEPVYGMAVMGVVDPRRVIASTDARVGDRLVLTKPLGTGIVTTAMGRGLASRALQRRAIESMCALNVAGAEVAQRGLVRAGADVTGFGLLGHLANLCRASGVSADLDATAVPALAPDVFELIGRDCIPDASRQNRAAADATTDWRETDEIHRALLTDAQTNGGLLLCVAEKHLPKVLEHLTRAPTSSAAVIGRIVAADTPLLRVFGGGRRRASTTSGARGPRARRKPPRAIPEVQRPHIS